MVLERSKEDHIAEVVYPQKITKGFAYKTANNWLLKGIKATDLNKAALIEEIYLVYIPFWRYIAQGKGIICGFAEYREKTGNLIRNKYEELIDDEYIWTEAAADTGKYGIKELTWLDPGKEVPYIHGTLPVIDAGGSAAEAKERGTQAIIERMKEKEKKRIETMTFEKTFIIPKVFEIVYVPLWITHYSYKGGNFTVIVDAVKGTVIGGTSPINMNARTRLMIFSFSIGGIMIGATIGMLLGSRNFAVSELVQCIILLIGVIICMAAYPAFRTGKRITAEGTMAKIDKLRPAVRLPSQLSDFDLLKRKNSILECPVCGNKLERPWGEVVSACDKCGTLLDVDSSGAEVVPYSVVEPNIISKTVMNNTPDYIPFWCFDCEVTISDYLCVGDTETGLPDIQGRRNYYICAADIPRYMSEPWEIDLTIRNPEMKLSSPDSLEMRKPIYITQKNAKELTEFLYLRYEMEKPGILQVLNYNFDFKSAAIIYIPYFKEEDKYIVGV